MLPILRIVALAVLFLPLAENASSAALKVQQADSHAAAVDYWALYGEAVRSEKGGVDVRRDVYKARDLYERVARGKDREAAKWASFKLGGLYKRAPFRNRSKAKQFYQAALDMGELWSAGFLVELYAQEPRTRNNKAAMNKLLKRMEKSDQIKLRKWSRELKKTYGLTSNKD